MIHCLLIQKHWWNEGSDSIQHLKLIHFRDWSFCKKYKSHSFKNKLLIMIPIPGWLTPWFLFTSMIHSFTRGDLSREARFTVNVTETMDVQTCSVNPYTPGCLCSARLFTPRSFRTSYTMTPCLGFLIFRHSRGPSHRRLKTSDAVLLATLPRTLVLTSSQSAHNIPRMPWDILQTEGHQSHIKTDVRKNHEHLHVCLCSQFCQ